jgi:ADP-dependent NAD(P)H-hydrate dehydratase / NAD(P)H-hydrate epimerase
VTGQREFLPDDAARLIAVPRETDDKYRRGVLGVVTGSELFPGAAVLGVEAALRTGVGMVRYLGPAQAATLVLQRRPEAVTEPGRVQAWLLGSGVPVAASRADRDPATRDRFQVALESGRPLVLDAGALDLAALSSTPTVITPHAGELARLLDVDAEAVRAEPIATAQRAAERFDVTVLLKGHTTHVVGPAGECFFTRTAPTWTATAGAGDALAGVLGALVATHSDAVSDDDSMLPRLAAAAAVIHGLAAHRASAGGPFTVLDLCRELGPVVAQLVKYRPHG